MSAAPRPATRPRSSSASRSALKDLYGVDGLPLTASSRVLEGNLAGADSTVWARLRERGMVLLGHTHTHEFAAGGTTDQVGNPHSLRLIAGGSSGGSAAALAARMTPAALGSDTCGSLRIPSACCGTCAIKPTHGRVPLDGIVPLAPSLDHPGPMARTIADCAALLAGMAAGGAQVTPLMPPPAPLDGPPLARAFGRTPAGRHDDRAHRPHARDHDRARGRTRARGGGAHVRATRRAHRRIARAVDVRMGRPQLRAADRRLGLSPRPGRPPRPLPPGDRRVRRGGPRLQRRPGLPRRPGPPNGRDGHVGGLVQAKRRRPRARADAADPPLRARARL